MSKWPTRVARLAVAAAAMTLAGSAVTPSVTNASASTTALSISRIAGSDQYATAAAIATSSFTTAATAIVTTSAAPYDAAAANYLGGAIGAPILLTAVTSLPSATAAALRQLRATKVIVVGGELAVSASVVGSLQSQGLSVARVAGPDHFATAAAIATDLGPAPVGTTGGDEHTAIVVSGYSQGDLQSIGPMAFSGPYPVLYSNRAGLPQSAKDSLTSLGIDHVIVVGGPLAVPSGVEGMLTSMGITSERVGGANALETAAQLANFEIAHLGFATNHVDFARGDDYADALAGGSHAGLVPGPILLTANPTTLGGATAAWLAHQCPSLTTAHVLGGPLAISDAVVSQIQQIVATCGGAAANVVTPTVPGGSTGGGSGGGGGTTPTSLVLTPESSYVVSGSSATMTATVTSNGSPVAGVPVDFFVVDASTEGSQPSSGVCTLSAAAVPSSTGSTSCTIDSADPVTNASGQATFSFHWASPVGKRPIEGSWAQTVYAFTGAQGAPFSLTSTGLLWDDASVTWVNAVSAIALTPSAMTFPYGGTATVSATLETLNDEGELAPVHEPGQTIRWAAYRGATCTLGATTPPSGTPTESGTVTTDSAGTATISYSYAPDPVPTTDTVDCLFAFYDQNNDGLLQGTEPATTGAVTWSSNAAVPSVLTVTPSGASKLAAPGASQVLSARVTDQYGSAVPGVTVDWSITRNDGTGTSVVASGSGVTDANGTVNVTDPSPAGSALDTMSATTPGGLSGQAAVYWVVPAASGSYSSLTVLNSEPTSETGGFIDVQSAGSYLRLYYDSNDVLMVGSRAVQTERFTESLAVGATLTASPYSADPSGVSTFTVASTGGGGGHGGMG